MLLACAMSGKAVKNSFASRASTAGSGTPAGKSLPVSHTPLQALSRTGPGAPGSLGVMVVADLDVLEHSDRVLRQDRNRAVERNQVRGNRFDVDSHEANGEAGSLFTWKHRLKKPYDALFFFADAQQKDVRLAATVLWLGFAVDVELFGREEGGRRAR